MTTTTTGHAGELTGLSVFHSHGSFPQPTSRPQRPGHLGDLIQWLMCVTARSFFILEIKKDQEELNLQTALISLSLLVATAFLTPRDGHQPGESWGWVELIEFVHIVFTFIFLYDSSCFHVFLQHDGSFPLSLKQCGASNTFC